MTAVAEAPIAAPVATDVTFRVRRFLPEVDADPHWEEYTVPLFPTDRVLTALEKIKGEVDAEHRGDTGRGAGLDEAHCAINTVAIGECEPRLAVLGRTCGKSCWHRSAMAQRIRRRHVEVGKFHSTRLTPSPAGTAAGQCAATCTPGRGRSRHHA